jgi:uncharacterized NAD(P)/FAD-binding protein YdhS
MIISIVGGGATGITALRHLAELACANPSRNLVTAVQLFDKSGFDGGVAYRTTGDQRLLNTKASRMSIMIGDSDLFLRWTEQHGLRIDLNDNLPQKYARMRSIAAAAPESRFAWSGPRSCKRCSFPVGIYC